MIKANLNLPTSRVLRVSIVKRNNLDDAPLLPDMGKIRRATKGSKISRYFRHITEHAQFKKIVGTNLAAFALVTSIIPQPQQIQATETFDTQNTIESSLTETPIVFTTIKSNQYPAKTIVINQGYNKFIHPGIDFDGVTGDPIYPVIEGFVEKVGYSRFGYGNAILVRHLDKSEALYAHLSKINVKRGDLVTFDDVIGEVGSTGRSTGSHLHLEIRKEGKAINPFTILPQI